MIELFCHNHTWLLPGEVEVVELLDPRKSSESWGKVGLPVIGWHHSLTRLRPNQLRDVHSTHCALPDGAADVIQTGDRSASELLFEESKAPVRGELGVADHQKVEGNGLMQAHHAPPGTVPYQVPVLVLSCAVVTMQIQALLPKSIVVKEMVEVADDGVGSFASAVGLID